MKESKDYYLYRCPIKVKINVNEQENEYFIGTKLPSDYTLENGFFSFPAGERDEYIIFNGLLYDISKYGSVEKIQDIIKESPIADGFKEAEMQELIDGIDVKIGNTKFLDLGESHKWLDSHLEIKNEAMNILQGAIEEANKELSEAGRSRRKGMR